MVINNIWSIRKSFGIVERVEDVRLCVVDHFVRNLKMSYETEYGVYDEFGSDYVPLFYRNRESLNVTRLDGQCDHNPVKLKGVYRRCVYHRDTSRTNHYCSKCKVHVHAGKCWRKWHTEKNL